MSIKDMERLRMFGEIDKLSDKDKGIIKEILNLFILKNKFQSLAALKDA